MTNTAQNLHLNNALLDSIRTVDNNKTTENGANALKSTLSPLLDLFGLIGALRCRSDEDILELFIPAFAADPELALKMLFYARDIRGGLGERRVFRVILTYLAKNHSDILAPLIHLIPEYGRWDDLFVLYNTPLESNVANIINEQLVLDYAAAHGMNHTSPASLLAKWLKTESASSEESKAIAKKTIQLLSITPSKYRHIVSDIRKHLKVVERSMSAKEWESIDYPSVPSKAALNYKNAFSRNDYGRYTQYINDISLGKTKINAATLYPYDIVNQYIAYLSLKDDALESLWKALPDYLSEEDKFLVMPDTSGSMLSSDSPGATPFATSVGLAIYFAEHSKGPFANSFISFTDNPRLVTLNPSLSLADRVKIVTNGKYVGYSTNIEAAFDLVLKAAVKDNLPQSDLPSAIVIISDMEFDPYDMGSNTHDFTSAMKKKFAQAGYKIPTLIYWNVEARQNTFHADATEDVRFVSGKSASVFKGLCSNKSTSALDFMLEVLNQDRYSPIKVSK